MMAQPGSDMQLARRGVALHVPFAARACWRYQWRWLGGCQKYRRAHGKFSPPGALSEDNASAEGVFTERRGYIHSTPLDRTHG